MNKKRASKVKPKEFDEITTALVNNYNKLDFKFKKREFKFTDKQQKLIEILKNPDNKIILIEGPAGVSKAQPLDSVLITPNGEVQMRDISVGDFVIGVDGKPTKVLGIYPQGFKPIYKVTFSDGTYTECSDDHLWETQTYNERNNRSKKNGIKYKNPKLGKIRTTLDIKDSLYARNGSHINHSIPITNAVDFEKRALKIDPYILGALIGDGGLKYSCVAISTEDSELIEYFKTHLHDLDFRFDGRCTYFIKNKKKNNNQTWLKAEINKLGLNVGSEYKFVPDDYKYSDINDRIELLKGLMDTDGSISNGAITFSSSSERLCDDVIYIVQSLGGIATKHVYKAGYKKDDKYIECKNSFRVILNLPNDIIPFKLSRKIEKYKPRVKYKPIRYITNVEYIKNAECQCIYVEHPRHLYLTNNFIVTHNTILAVYCGLMLLKEEKIDKLLYIRSVVESAHKSLGFLPGNLEEKMQMWRQPLDDKFEELVEAKDISKLRSTDKIEVVPINYIRGASWRNSFVIFDEFQNTLLSEAKTILTRIGENTQLILCGDAEQSDIKDSGFKKVFSMFNNSEAKEKGVITFKFTENDIVRSEIVKYIVHKFKELDGNT